MTEQIKQFIDQLAGGENADAKDTLDNIISSKAFSALDEYKKELAQSVFGGTNEVAEQPEIETQETE